MRQPCSSTARGASTSFSLCSDPVPVPVTGGLPPLQAVILHSCCFLANSAGKKRVCCVKSRGLCSLLIFRWPRRRLKQAAGFRELGRHRPAPGCAACWPLPGNRANYTSGQVRSADVQSQTMLTPLISELQRSPREEEKSPSLGKGAPTAPETVSWRIEHSFRVVPQPTPPLHFSGRPVGQEVRGSVSFSPEPVSPGQLATLFTGPPGEWMEFAFC